MRRVLWAGLLFGGCEHGGDDAAVHPLPGDELLGPPAFQLGVSNLIAGSTATIVVLGAPPSSLVRFAVSTHGLGLGTCAPVFGGQCLSIANPATQMAISAFTDPSGEATVNLVVPSTGTGLNVAFQGVILGSTVRLSNPVARLVGTAGTVITPTGDFDLDGYTPIQGDCADFNPSIHPGAVDVGGDGYDTDCDNQDGTDGDGDGWVSGSDCDDTDPLISPSARDVCNGLDDDCSGVVDRGATGAACGRTDTFTSGATRADLLFVVDNSCSMSEEQGRLTSQSWALFDPVVASGADVHVGVITTDMADVSQSGRLQDALGWRYSTGVVDHESWFNVAADVGTSGSADERGRDAVLAALTPPLINGHNAGFMRSDADLHVVVVSDEEDVSTANLSQFTSWLPTLKTGGYTVLYHALVGPPGGCTTAVAGTSYISVAQATGGLVSSICATDYTGFLSDLADEVGTGTASAFVLSESANPATLQVTADIPGVGLVVLAAGNWTYDAPTRTITLVGLSLPPGGTLNVTYDL